MNDEMNPWLAEMYNTNGAAQAASEEQEKLAQADLFAKLAADQNIDLSQFTPAEIAEVYATTFPEELAKLAEEEEEGVPPKKKDDEEEDEDEKKEAAALYHQEKVAEVDKFAEADIMGRIMAHSFTDELEKIKEAASVSEVGKKALEVGRKAGGKILAAGKKAGGKVVEAPGEFLRANRARKVGNEVLGIAKQQAGGKGAVVEGAKAAVKGSKDRMKTMGKRMALTAGGGAAVVGGGALALKKGKGKDKEASAAAFEEFSANHAIKVAEAGGYNTEEATERVSAVYSLGLEETEKVAYVQDTDEAVHVRGLEYLEAAGYPVDWEQVFGEE